MAFTVLRQFFGKTAVFHRNLDSRKRYKKMLRQQLKASFANQSAAYSQRLRIVTSAARVRHIMLIEGYAIFLEPVNVNTSKA